MAASGQKLKFSIPSIVAGEWLDWGEKQKLPPN